MEPEWHQDIHSKGIQPRHLPHFETAGHQVDWEYRKRAGQMVISATGFGFLTLLLCTALFFVPRVLKERKSSFGQLPGTEREQTHQGRISLRVHNVTRERKVPGQLFMSVTARDGFQFLVMDISVQNRASEPFQFNPLAFGLYTGDGTLYRTAFSTHHHPKGLDSQKIKPGERIQGVVLFQIPTASVLDSLELMGANDTIAVVQL